MKIGKIEISGSFFLFFACLNYLDRQTLVPLALLACVLHELGHYCAIRLVKKEIKLIRLTAVGAEMVIDGPMNYWQEGLAALAGPGVNLLTALTLCCQSRGEAFAGLNLALGCFNMMPVGQLDGGRVLRCTLALWLGPDLAHRIAEKISLTFAAVLLTAGAAAARAWGNVTLLLVASWITASLFHGKREEIGLARLPGKR